jgi:hypothetical protein
MTTMHTRLCLAIIVFLPLGAATPAFGIGMLIPAVQKVQAICKTCPAESFEFPLQLFQEQAGRVETVPAGATVNVWAELFDPTLVALNGATSPFDSELLVDFDLTTGVLEVHFKPLFAPLVIDQDNRVNFVTLEFTPLRSGFTEVMPREANIVFEDQILKTFQCPSPDCIPGSINIVPEPSTFSLMGLLLCGLAITAARRAIDRASGTDEG